MSLKDKNVVVTGGNRGVGQARVEEAWAPAASRSATHQLCVFPRSAPYVRPAHSATKPGKKSSNALVKTEIESSQP
jgi:hypothetical protein